MKLAGIFEDLEHFMVFKQLAMVAIFFSFFNEAKIYHRQVFIAINIPCQYAEDIEV